MNGKWQNFKVPETFVFLKPWKKKHGMYVGLLLPLWDVGSFLLGSCPRLRFFFHTEVTVFTTDLANISASQNIEILKW